MWYANRGLKIVATLVRIVVSFVENKTFFVLLVHNAMLCLTQLNWVGWSRPCLGGARVAAMGAHVCERLR
jgi:hypothetical protein